MILQAKELKMKVFSTKIESIPQGLRISLENEMETRIFVFVRKKTQH